MQNAGFGFGIETELLLVDRESFKPLWHRELKFEQLFSLIDSIDCSEISENGFNVKPLHTKPTPYLVEGYYLTDEELNPLSLLPKGIEIRTPLSDNFLKSIGELKLLFERLRERALQDGYDLAVLSQHPTESVFEAPPNYKRHDYWQWALTATTTYGPDINISLPAELSAKIDLANLAVKLNYYMPSAIALSLASPILHGALWFERGRYGKSVRTHRRSIWAPIFYVHHKPALRYEFKGFEMARCLEDYEAFFLISLALLLDEKLVEKADDQTRIYDLGFISLFGLESEQTCLIASNVLEAAERTAEKYGFDRKALDQFWNRLETKQLPADQISEIFRSEKDLAATLAKLIGFYASDESRYDDAVVKVTEVSRK